MTINLNDQEHDLLVRILDRELGELHTEIRHTDARSFRAELKKEEHLLRDLCQRLKTAVAT